MQRRDDSCGTLLLGHFGALIGVDLGGPEQLEIMHPLFAMMSRCYIDHRLGGGPSSSEEIRVQRELEGILLEKGVPGPRVQERANMAIKKMGIKDLQHALEQKNPWQWLKAVASRPNISFQWVKHDELQTKIKEKATQKFKIQPSAKRKQNSTKNQSSNKTLTIDPQQLAIIKDTFTSDGGTIGQLAFSEIAPEKTGIAICSVGDAIPYIQAGEVISKRALGLLTTTCIPADYHGVLKIEDLRFPVLCQDTNEPCLVSGSMVTLGSVAIRRSDKSQNFKFDSVDTQTLKFFVYRDEWPGDWGEFAERPFRHLQHRIPSLQLCREASCGQQCRKYHLPVDEEAEALIIDLWNRTWLTEEGKFTKPRDAACWTVMVRVPLFAQLTLQGLSAVDGFYVEPRSSSGHATDENYVMIWLNNISLASVIHKMRTTENAIAVGRLHRKVGIRVREADAAEAFKALRPKDEYIPAKTKAVYKIFPLPYGTQKQSLQKAITSWGWRARVLQPLGGSLESTSLGRGAFVGGVFCCQPAS